MPYFDSFSDTLEQCAIKKTSAEVQAAFAGKPVINIGAGMLWRKDAHTLLHGNHPFPLHPSYVTAVDPFFDEEEGEQMRMVQQDGLSYL